MVENYLLVIWIKRELTDTKSLELNGVAEKALGVVQNAALAPSIQTAIL